jgi:hypothetical protein
MRSLGLIGGPAPIQRVVGGSVVDVTAEDPGQETIRDPAGSVAGSWTMLRTNGNSSATMLGRNVDL